MGEQKRGGKEEERLCEEVVVAAMVSHLMVLPVRRRIHCGRGRFCRIFFPRRRLILSDLCAPCGKRSA